MSRQDIIKTAALENGTKESPANSNKTKYGLWYGLNGEKWCAIFVSWVYDHAGYPLGFIESSKGYQSCQGGYNFWKAKGQLTKDPQPGDIVLFDWDGNGHCDHTGIFESWVDFTKTNFFSWEGNTSVNDDSNGGVVMRRTRNRALVKSFASPGILNDPSPAITDNNLKKGDIGTGVTTLQKVLYDLQYPITVDGIFGDETEAIIKQFQKKYNLEATGMVSPALLGALKGEMAEPNVPAKKFTSGSYLRKGNSGSAVIDLQNALNNAGANPTVSVDGVFGNETFNALKAFQQKNKMTVDGVAGPATFSGLGLKV
ncbi:MAG: peptidoglycan-binding protein [Ginsengibacter sp.]